MPVYRKVGEGSSFTVRIRCFDDANALTTPVGIKYRIDCDTSDATIRDWTAITPGADVTVRITSDDTKIVDDAHPEEVRSLTVVVDDDLDTQFVVPVPYQFAVTNVAKGKKVVP